MEIADAKRAVRIKQWAEMIQTCRQSGQTVKAWCVANGISAKTYYYRLKRVRLEVLRNTVPDANMLPSNAGGSPAFAELKLIKDNLTETQAKGAYMSPVTITIGQISVSIQNEAEPDVIAYVIKAVNEICKPY